MTGQEFLKKRGLNKTVIFLSCMRSQETSHVHGENGTEYKQGPNGRALMLCCDKWVESGRVNSQLETDPHMVSVASIRAAVKRERMNNGHTRQYSLLTPPAGNGELSHD